MPTTRSGKRVFSEEIVSSHDENSTKQRRGRNIEGRPVPTFEAAHTLDDSGVSERVRLRLGGSVTRLFSQSTADACLCAAVCRAFAFKHVTKLCRLAHGSDSGQAVQALIDYADRRLTLRRRLRLLPELQLLQTQWRQAKLHWHTFRLLEPTVMGRNTDCGLMETQLAAILPEYCVLVRHYNHAIWFAFTKHAALQSIADGHCATWRQIVFVWFGGDDDVHFFSSLAAPNSLLMTTFARTVGFLSVAKWTLSDLDVYSLRLRLQMRRVDADS